MGIIKLMLEKYMMDIHIYKRQNESLNFHRIEPLLIFVRKLYLENVSYSPQVTHHIDITKHANNNSQSR